MANESPQIWRLHLKSDADEGCDPSEFCTQTNIVGIGWPVEAKKVEALSWDEYCLRARTEYKDSNGWQAAANAIHAMKKRDLCWTRTRAGKYWVGRIEGDWEYRNSPENCRTDVYNVRECQWACVGDMHEVPGKIVNSLRASRTLQRVDGESIQLFSMFTSNAVHNGTPYEFRDVKCDLFSLLCPEDCEDVVGVYLQMNGYVLYPGTCKADTKQFEFVLRHRETGRLAAVQVKQGHVSIRDEDYCTFDGDVILFQTEDNYVGPTYPNTHRLTKAQMHDFCKAAFKVLPPRTQRWISLTEELEQFSSIS